MGYQPYKETFKFKIEAIEGLCYDVYYWNTASSNWINISLSNNIHTKWGAKRFCKKWLREQNKVYNKDIEEFKLGITKQGEIEEIL